MKKQCPVTYRDSSSASTLDSTATPWWFSIFYQNYK